VTRRLVVLALVGAGCAALAVTASSAGRARPPLSRPLHLPRIVQGARCPVSRVDRRIPFVHRFGVDVGIGKGPAYPIGLRGGKLELAPAANFHSKWAGQKVLWLVLPSYRGRVLIRGARIDGAGRVRFQRGDVPPLSLRIGLHPSGGSPGSPVPPRGTRYFPSYTRVRGPGCYAYQIDGTSFSRVVVFRAVWG
jgi:hypothetical protein